ncbi:Y-family DNA polymerase [Photobacterium japonica]|uniref:Y-family DNA polymerase n=1 Tax=Photobacterium japonica TaxID=2910235 RepID=UPI003D0F04C4
MFALVDANAFYCSAEQVFRPDWRGKPIIVLSNNDGMVVAANRQAKDVGIKKCKPYFAMRDLCEQKGVIACSSNYELYGDLSAKMMEVIGRFAPDQYIYSIDESFLSFQRCQQAIPDLTAHAQALRKAVWKECRLPVCVGMGSTLTLAKVANHAAKKMEAYQGVCVLRTDTARRTVLSAMDVQDVWGIGPRTAKQLRIMGVRSALQLAEIPPALARKNFNVEIERTVRELNGEACKGWGEARADKQQIFSTRSVGDRIVCAETLSQALCRQGHIAAEKLRQQGSLCQHMMVFASNSPFDEKPVTRRFQYRFAYPTDDTCTLMQVIAKAVAELFVPGVRFYKLGVGLIDLVDGSHAQFDLFDPHANNLALMKAFDGLNAKYGTGTVFMAAQGTTPKWTMRRDRLTPQYTTRWHDIPTIRC